MEESRPQAPELPGPAPTWKWTFLLGIWRTDFVHIFGASAVLIMMAAIAIPNFISYKCRGFNSAANADVKNAYISSQAYFSDHPHGFVDLPTLARYGFTQEPKVTVEVLGETRSALSITARHKKSTTTYTVDSTGRITKG